MVYGTYNYSYWGESKPTNITGGGHIAWLNTTYCNDPWSQDFQQLPAASQSSPLGHRRPIRNRPWPGCQEEKIGKSTTLMDFQPTIVVNIPG